MGGHTVTTFARIVGGYALDCRVHASATELAACFHPEFLAENPFAVVPDGTRHGAKDNGNGTFTNLPLPAPVTVPERLLRKDARAVVIAALGGNGAGSAKLQSYRDVASANTATTQAAQNMRLALEIWRTDDYFTQADVDSLMAAFQFASGDRAAVNAQWPFKVINP